MRDVDRILGALQEFKSTTKQRLDSIESKVEKIQYFYWKVIGGTTVVSVIATFVIELFFFKKG